MRFDRADAIALAAGAGAFVLTQLDGPDVEAAVGGLMLVLGVALLTRDALPVLARGVALALAVGSVVALGFALSSGYLLALGLVSGALGLWQTRASHALLPYAAILLAGAAGVASPPLGVAALALLLAQKAKPMEAVLSLGISLAWPPWTADIMLIEAAILAAAYVLGRAASGGAVRRSLQAAPQRVLLSLAALLPGLAVAASVLGLHRAGGQVASLALELPLAALAGLAAAVTLVGYSVLLATTSALRSTVLGAPLAAIAAAALLGPGAILLAAFSLLLASTVGAIAVARAIPRPAWAQK